MATRRKPTHPSAITREMVDNSFLSNRREADLHSSNPKNDLEKFRARKEAGKPDRILALRNTESLRSIRVRESGFAKSTVERMERGEENFNNLPEAKVKERIEAAVVHIADATQAVRKARTRMIEQRLPAKAPAAKRVTEKENLTKDGSVTRERVKSPFTLPAILRESLAETLKDMKAAGKFNPEGTRPIIPEASQRGTRLDKALDEHEADALATYLEDRALEAATLKIGSYGGGHGGEPAWNRSPMSGRTQKALARLAHVHKHVNADDRADLIRFARMCVPIDNLDAMTTREFGQRICKSDARDICEGAFVGAMKKIAQRLYWLYKLHHTTLELLDKTAKSRGLHSATTCHTLAA